MLSKLKEKYFNYLNGFRYELGLVKLDGETDLLSQFLVKKLKWVKGYPKTSWFADPFIYKITEKEIYIFAEEWIYTLGRGVISLVVVDKESYEYIRHKELLRLETHLSWPYIVEEEGKTYVIPENSESGKSIKYLYDEEEELLIFDEIIAEKAFIDPVFFSEGSRDFCLTSLPEDIQDTLHLFERSEAGKYIPLEEKYTFSKGLARGAGAIFKHKEKLYKPNQIGIKNYGEGVAIFEKEEPNQFNEIVRLYPIDKQHSFGIHTFNIKDNYLIVDGEGPRYFYLRKVLLFLSKIFPFLPKQIRKS